MFESQNPNSEASKQAYLRDAANYMFDKYGEAAIDRLTQDFDACMKEFHEHRLEVLRKLQTPEGVVMIREMTYAKIKERQMEGYEAEAKALLPSTEDEVAVKCGNCGKNDAEELHTCPYQEDINGNYTSLCNCCVSCQNGCAGDI